MDLTSSVLVADSNLPDESHMESLRNFVADYYGLIAIASVVSFVAGLFAVPWVLARIPSDYFITHREYLSRWKVRRPVLRLALILLRNLIGIVLALLGVLMLVTPGQGVITLLLGISLTTFPGKRRLELSLLRRPGVLRTINWLREKSHRQPLIIPDRDDGSSEEIRDE